MPYQYLGLLYGSPPARFWPHVYAGVYILVVVGLCSYDMAMAMLAPLFFLFIEVGVYLFIYFSYATRWKLCSVADSGTVRASYRKQRIEFQDGT